MNESFDRDSNNNEAACPHPDQVDYHAYHELCKNHKMVSMSVKSYDEQTWSIMEELYEDAGIYLIPHVDPNFPEFQIPTLYVSTRQIIGEEAIRAYKEEQIRMEEEHPVINEFDGLWEQRDRLLGQRDEASGLTRDRYDSAIESLDSRFAELIQTPEVRQKLTQRCRGLGEKVLMAYEEELRMESENIHSEDAQLFHDNSERREPNSSWEESW